MNQDAVALGRVVVGIDPELLEMRRVPYRSVCSLMTLPHGGGIDRACSQLTHFEWEGTPTSDAHAALRDAACDWLKRPS